MQNTDFYMVIRGGHLHLHSQYWFVVYTHFTYSIVYMLCTYMFYMEECIGEWTWRLSQFGLGSWLDPCLLFLDFVYALL
jgi:hypothetical protein